MNKSIYLLLILLLLLSACQGSAANVPVTGDDVLVTSLPLASPTPRPTALPSPTATATPLSAEDQAKNLAEAAAKAYFATLAQGDVNATAQQLSIFSLDAYNMTASDAAGALNIQRSAGTRWSNFQVLG